ncbi:MAG: enoyl-CoA hydratase/isomerase family protein [Acidimicrobiia bacterium]|nr:enoyl-CoA hydratase/isomerase family protein [Acidimicrobiia bacterium]
MSEPCVRVERDGRVAVVTFDRGVRANALSVDAMSQLTEVAHQLDDDPEVSAVVLTGRADNFSYGVDLKDPEQAAAMAVGLAERRSRARLGPRMCEAWERLEALTIVAIEGYCIGGGAALAVSLDLRVMADDAVLYVPEIERGMNMSWGSVPRIVNLVGPARAKRIVVLAEQLDAQRCAAWGLADEVTSAGGALEGALALAHRVAELPPVQVRMCKQGCNLAATALNTTASAMDRDQFLLAASSDDYAEGVRSFLEGRPPRYTGG